MGAAPAAARDGLTRKRVCTAPIGAVGVRRLPAPTLVHCLVFDDRLWSVTSASPFFPPSLPLPSLSSVRSRPHVKALRHLRILVGGGTSRRRLSGLVPVWRQPWEKKGGGSRIRELLLHFSGFFFSIIHSLNRHAACPSCPCYRVCPNQQMMLGGVPALHVLLFILTYSSY